MTRCIAAATRAALLAALPLAFASCTTLGGVVDREARSVTYQCEGGVGRDHADSRRRGVVPQGAGADDPGADVGDGEQVKLAELNPKFLPDSSGRQGTGIMLDCPCGNADPDHRLFVPFVVALDGSTRPGEQGGWQRTGDTFDTLTLSPSVLRVDDCKWHGWIRNGEAVTC